ncbi:MAG: ATP-dependent 6-phosphofructokinase [bacterium]
MKKVGILTGGGDCPGLNPAIRGASLKAIDLGYEVIGILEGWRGLLELKTRKINVDDVFEIINRGGTILGTSRTNPIKMENGIKKCMENIKKLGLDGLIAMGGDDTLGVASKLYEAEKVPVVGVPKTMDNDLMATDYTFGFDTAVTIAVDAAERLKDTGRSHRRIMVLEVMGRHAGWVALFTGIASAADWILVPEEEPKIDDMCKHLIEVHAKKDYALVVVSEGVKLPDQQIGNEELDQFGHMILKGRAIGDRLAKTIEKQAGIETRIAVIGHIQRGGAPTLFDRILGSRVGYKAMELIAEEKFGNMVALKGDAIVPVSLKDATKQLKTVSQDWLNFAKVFFK